MKEYFKQKMVPVPLMYIYTYIQTDIDKDINPQFDKCIDLRSLMFDHAITKLEREYH